MSAGESVAGDVVHVVADRFGGFAGNADVITLGALRRALASAEFAESRGRVPAVLAPGQGIDARQWAELTAQVRRRGLPQGPHLTSGPAEPADPAEVLKLRRPNVLLSEVREDGPLRYAADLVVTDGTEMILDHTAERQHLPGLLLMEACCQMIIAVTRRFLVGHGHEHYAVMQHFDIDFRRFVFPLSAELVLSIDAYGDESAGHDGRGARHDSRGTGHDGRDTGHDGRDAGADCDRMPFEVTIDIVQGAKTCARAHWRYRAFRPATVFAAEARQAAAALTAATSHTLSHVSEVMP
ncbi:AfsA-related hotdog domain-containing protein [Streptomyces sp. R28]|uniref:AfsA-related hotdog domain-containing protein n=1 Tax=Streptomyces sp. R28 TaxID=3238628 RepID=A0AB39Q5P4_9ACTN